MLIRTLTNLCALLVLVLVAALPVATLAEDEDLTTSVYLVFDPETGEFAEVNDPNKVQQTHDMKDPAAAAATEAAITSRPSMYTLALVLAVLLALFGIYKIVTRNKSSTA